MPARYLVLGAFLVACLAGAGTIRVAHSQTEAAPDATEGGKRVFKTNCASCHKWHGNGGGGYGGDALSLRKTQLTREQIIETVSCGRPGTGMPYFLRGAYEDKHCYGLTKHDVGTMMPPEAPTTFLRPPEIGLVADYVIAHLKGKGEPNYADCTAFFGEGSRVCDVYKTGG
jgi:mono/diheme cytochrome c family protein